MILDFITRYFTPMIVVVGTLHLVFFGVLWLWARRDLKKIARMLQQFTDGLHSRSLLDHGGHLSDQIDAFVADVDDALLRDSDRRRIAQRMQILDGRRGYLNSFRFETAWNVARASIEAYPLLGVLGTIFALWLAMRGRDAVSSTPVGEIVNRFGLAIDSTFAGLAMAILLMIVNSVFETLFSRLAENRRLVREVVAKAKRELMSVRATDANASDHPNQRPSDESAEPPATTVSE